MYRVSVGEKALQVTLLQPNLQQENQIKIEALANTKYIEALNLEHPIIKWVERLRRQCKTSDMDTNNKHVKSPGILMDKSDAPTLRDFLPVLE